MSFIAFKTLVVPFKVTQIVIFHFLFLISILGEKTTEDQTEQSGPNLLQEQKQMLVTD